MRNLHPDLRPDRATEDWVRALRTDIAETVTVRCKLITPMYGGGIRPGEVDTEMPIRASAVRGQLRFWWRLLYTAGLPPRAGFSLECSLWGGIRKSGSRASLVTLRVKSRAVRANQLVRKVEISTLPRYALILESNENPRLLRAGHEFDVVLQFSRASSADQKEQVLDTLRWWTSFGGVGSRTRRGLGAVKAASNDCELMPISCEEVKRRGGWLAIGSQAAVDPGTAWRRAVDRLETFRQGVGVGRRSGTRGKPGRSNWPEAANIRNFARDRAARQIPMDQSDEYYPRAAFGLPIVFHFKQERKQQRTADHVLEPIEGERMASPLILRPYPQDKQYRPAALLVPGWRDRLSVTVGFRNKTGESRRAWPLREDERARLAKPMVPFKSGLTDPLTAFMQYFSNSVRA